MRIPGLGSVSLARVFAVAVPFAAIVPAARLVPFGELRAAAGNPVSPPQPRAELVNVPRRPPAPAGVSFDTLTGRSGRLRVRLLAGDEASAVPALTALHGAAVRVPGVRMLPLPLDDSEFAFITLKPWRDKLGSFINTYHVGYWPGERGPVSDAYDNPAGFIEVTRENQHLRLSTHFTLRDFVTRDQEHTWPKYVVLREDLIDKLELVLMMLESQGIPTRHVKVLSGFRTPQHNARAAFEGAAYASRHLYGDAVDLIVDADRDGRMDDLNRDGTVNFQDTDVINRAVEMVERRHPDLVGGLGLYHAMGPAGPFAHIDVRGTRARWVNDGTPRVQRVSAGETALSAGPMGKCRAEGEMASLCARVR